MKIAIFGAGGRTGILAVFQALDKGHEVTAYTRKAERVTIRHPRLRIVEGDILDPARVKEAVTGQDAVICALGINTRKPSTRLSEATAIILEAMKETGVNRFICMSSAGILGNDSSFFFEKIMIPLLLRNVFRDKVRQAEIIQNSGLDWIIVRPTWLTDSPKTGTYKIRTGKPASSSVPRADVADFMLKLVSDRQYDHTLPAISS
jgi:putative NADH-flavin reductase